MEILTLWPLSQGETEGIRESFVDVAFADERQESCRRLTRQRARLEARWANAERDARVPEALHCTAVDCGIHDLPLEPQSVQDGLPLSLGSEGAVAASHASAA